MNIFRQPQSERWEQLKNRGFWRHTLVEGVLLFGLPFFVVMSTAAFWVHLRGGWKHPEPWYILLPFFLVGGLAGGLAVGVALWSYDRWCFARHKKRIQSK